MPDASSFTAALVIADPHLLPSSLARCAAISSACRAAVSTLLDRRRLDLSGGSEHVTVPLLPEQPDGPPPQALPDFLYHRDSIGFDASSRERIGRLAAAPCTCRDGACDDDCPCLRAGGAYDSSGRLLCLLGGREQRAEVPIVECSPACVCSARCASAVVSSGMRVRLGVFRTPSRGWGVRALEPLPRGSFVCEYAGEYLSTQEAARRRAARGGAPNYAICLREHSAARVLRTWIDPAARGNVGRFVNHSCEPNLSAHAVRAGSLVPRLALFARRDIAAGEELTMTYGDGAEAAGGGESAALGAGRRPCLCGAATCGGWLPFEPLPGDA